MNALQSHLVLVKGAGDLATGVIVRLHRAGFRVAATELSQPTVVRRGAAFAEAVFDGSSTVEGITARRTGLPGVEDLLAAGEIPVIIDPDGIAVAALRPYVLVDATVAKRNLGTRMADAPVVIALGPSRRVAA